MKSIKFILFLVCSTMFYSPGPVTYDIFHGKPDRKNFEQGVSEKDLASWVERAKYDPDMLFIKHSAGEEVFEITQPGQVPVFCIEQTADLFEDANLDNINNINIKSTIVFLSGLFTFGLTSVGASVHVLPHCAPFIALISCPCMSYFGLSMFYDKPKSRDREELRKFAKEMQSKGLALKTETKSNLFSCNTVSVRKHEIEFLRYNASTYQMELYPGIDTYLPTARFPQERRDLLPVLLRTDIYDQNHIIEYYPWTLSRLELVRTLRKFGTTIDPTPDTIRRIEMEVPNATRDGIPAFMEFLTRLFGPKSAEQYIQRRLAEFAARELTERERLAAEEQMTTIPNHSQNPTNAEPEVE